MNENEQSNPSNESDDVRYLFIKVPETVVEERANAPEPFSAFVGKIILHISEVVLGVTIADFILRVLPEIIKAGCTLG